MKTSVRLHVDQMMRAKNFKIRNDVVEREAVTKSHKGKNVNVERKVGECFQWKVLSRTLFEGTDLRTKTVKTFNFFLRSKPLSNRWQCSVPRFPSRIVHELAM